jgi:hypothetical protein
MTVAEGRSFSGGILISLSFVWQLMFGLSSKGAQSAHA